uniref:N-acetylglucosaminylphosphatidylinositol deacetylase n=1 Tax=Oncorhynchus tshawytscha TaxID=74940 RepID=A0A8C8GTN2_ONCTS
IPFIFVWIKCIYDQQNSAKSRKQLFKFVITLTAYPDDECMFFVPTILRLEELNASSFVYLKVGNYYNQCVQLPGSCAVLGIPASRVIMHDYLPDDPNVEWRISMASSLILKIMHKNELDHKRDYRNIIFHFSHNITYSSYWFTAVRVFSMLSPSLE